MYKEDKYQDLMLMSNCNESGWYISDHYIVSANGVALDEMVL